MPALPRQFGIVWGAKAKPPVSRIAGGFAVSHGAVRGKPRRPKPLRAFCVLHAAARSLLEFGPGEVALSIAQQLAPKMLDLPH